MRALLCLGVLVMACSSTAEFRSGAAGVSGGEPSSGDAAGVAGGAVAGAQGGGSSAVGGGTSGAAVGIAGAFMVAGSGGQNATGGTAQGGSPVTVVGGTGSSGSPPTGGAGGTSAGAAGEPPSDMGGAGAAGASNDGGAGGAPEPVCVCSSGPCCDGCQYLPSSHFCGEVIRSSECLQGGRISNDYWNLFCSGTEAASCTRWGAHTQYADPECGAGLVCAGAAGAASCQLAP